MLTEEQKQSFTEPECKILRFTVEDIMTSSTITEGWELPEY